jgi:hypothetical protein
MFDINNARDFYQKLLEDFDDYMQRPDSARHAMNCAITAHHVADWVWGDFVKGDASLKAKLGIKKKQDFMAWIDGQTVWYGLVQSISNGSKHFIRENAKGTQKVQGYGMGGFGQGPTDRGKPDRSQEHGSVYAVRGRHPILAGFSAAAWVIQSAA